MNGGKPCFSLSKACETNSQGHLISCRISYLIMEDSYNATYYNNSQSQTCVHKHSIKNVEVLQYIKSLKDFHPRSPITIEDLFSDKWIYNKIMINQEEEIETMKQNQLKLDKLNEELKELIIEKDNELDRLKNMMMSDVELIEEQQIVVDKLKLSNETLTSKNKVLEMENMELKALNLKLMNLLEKSLDKYKPFETIEPIAYEIEPIIAIPFEE
jgi:hypothetical protein